MVPTAIEVCPVPVSAMNFVLWRYYPCPHGRRVQYLVCVYVCVCLCYHEIAVNFNYLKI